MGKIKKVRDSRAPTSLRSPTSKTLSLARGILARLFVNPPKTKKKKHASLLLLYPPFSSARSACPFPPFHRGNIIPNFLAESEGLLRNPYSLPMASCAKEKSDLLA